MVLRTLARRGDALDQLAMSVKDVFRLEKDEEFAERIAKKIADMVKRGYKVYVTNRAAKVLEPILERYGIVLVPARKIEYPYILIDIPTKNTVFIRFKDQELRKVEREIPLKIFIEYIEKALKKYFEESKETHTIEIVGST